MPEAAGPITRSRDGQRRPCHLNPAAPEALTSWIDTYRLVAERRYRRLDTVLHNMKEQETMSARHNPTTIAAQPGTPFIDVVRDFDATPAQVFRASTDPELVAQWLGPRELEMDLIEYNVRPGGRYRYVHRDTEGNEYGFHGVFHAVTANERIVQTFEFDGAPGLVTLESTTFEDLGGRTRLHNHSVFPSIQARDLAIATGMEHGIADSMGRLDEVIRTDEP